MATTRRAYTGGATSTTTTSAIAASGTTSFTITAYTGWPYGTDPFFIVVEPGTASEEKILVTRTGSTDTTINIASDSERAQDGTSAVGHSSGSIVFPVFTALDADEANELTSSWSTKGDLVSYGSSTFETLGVGTDGQFLRADSGETSGLAWETFNNTLGSGSAVGTLGTFTAGSVLTAAELNQFNNVTVLRKTAFQSIASSTTTAIQFGSGTTLVDTTDWHSEVTNNTRITPTIGGYYLMFATSGLEAAVFSTSSRLYMEIAKNATAYVNGNLTSPLYPTLSVAGVVPMNGSTDYVELRIFQDSGSSHNSNVRTQFGVMLLR